MNEKPGHRISCNDEGYMQAALQAAAKWPTAAPNPRVGCVLVKDGKIIAVGAHQAAGRDHAEIVALKQAGAAAQGATCYVTLEPCCHFGKTPPCVDALIAAQIRQVVVAVVDPNPLVQGKGISTLQQHGISVTIGVLADQAVALNAGFFKRMQRQLPYVRSKIAVSLDGKVALANGISQWISCEHARQDVQQLRAQSCAIMTTSNTIIADDPLFTVRGAQLPPDWSATRQPALIILDRTLRVPIASKIFTVARDVRKIIIVTQEVDATRHKPYLALGCHILVQTTMDMNAIFSRLATEFHYNEILIEAGGKFNSYLLQCAGREPVVDAWILYQGMKILGQDSISAFNLTGQTDLAEVPKFSLTEVMQIGSSVRLILTHMRE